jgi:hypothetical protein
LDINANGEVLSLDEVLAKENVVGELYDDGSQRTDPQWINKFKERGYDILSVILDTKLETCVYRVNVKRGEIYSEDYVKEHYDNFHQTFKSIF